VRRWLTGAGAAALLAPCIAARPAGDPALVQVLVAPAAGPADVATGVPAGPGRVLTVAHVLEAGGRVSVREGDGRSHRARVARLDPRADLAVLEVPGLRAAPLRAGTGTAAARLLVRREGGVEARAVGVRRRIVARFRGPAGTPVRVRPALELAAQVAGGDSGAPVVTAGGRVAGIVYARSRERAATAYAVSAPAVAPLLRAR
jgi:S1-C subfamily serine protease